ncbi:hypothetical protein Misp01_00540 [Microtetraspora sp. NBRC 13810]|nr:hypothetical protein Misp01_00540 [Microtetraspora sp. NBRC 13810]
MAGQPRVLRRFHPPPEPWLSGHRGVDLAANPGDTVYAAGDGVIGFAGPVGGRGVVTITHENGLRTSYLPLTPTVKRNQQVQKGDPLGTLATPTTPPLPTATTAPTPTTPLPTDSPVSDDGNIPVRASVSGTAHAAVPQGASTSAYAPVTYETHRTASVGTELPTHAPVPQDTHAAAFCRGAEIPGRAPLYGMDHTAVSNRANIPANAPVLQDAQGTAASRGAEIPALPTGLTTHCPTSCLHWGLRRGPLYLDPLLLVGATHPRLLPLWTTTS